ncbi:MAG: hypothetical protein H6979_03220 [Chromatiales bacterium]|nr:hypothetical protein [Chromatiales bacterium]
MSAVNIGSTIAPWSRALAVVYLLTASLAVWSVDLPGLITAGNWSLQGMGQLALGLWVSALFVCAAWTGRAPPEVLCNPAVLWCWLRGTHPERASPLEMERLRQLKLKAGLFTSRGEARRLIGLMEGRMPPTLEQQRALALYRPDRAVMTRTSAERFLVARYDEEEWAEVLAWADCWAEIDVEIEHPGYPSPAERQAFDDAYTALYARGIHYPLPAVFPAFDIVSETARMQLALEMPQELQAIQQKFLREGITRRALAADEIWQMIAPMLDIWRREPDLEWADTFLFLLARDRPAVLVDPWVARELVTEMEAWLSEGIC